MTPALVRVPCILLVVLVSTVWSQSFDRSIEEDTESLLDDQPSPTVSVIPDSYWEVNWNNTGFTLDGSLVGSDGGVFSVTGQIVPGIDVSTIIDVAARSWNSDTLKQALGEICVAFGPTISVLVGDKAQQICEPVLESLRTGEPVQGVSAVCQDIWRKQEEEYEYEASWDTWTQWSPFGDEGNEGNEWESGRGILGPFDSGDRPSSLDPGSGNFPDDDPAEGSYGSNFWNIPGVGDFYPLQYLKRVLGFAEDNPSETCNRLGNVVYNRSLSGRELMRNVTFTAVKELLPLSLLSCGDSYDTDGETHLGKVLLQVFATLFEFGDAQQFCSEAGGFTALDGDRDEHNFGAMAANISTKLLRALVDDDSLCTDVISRLEEFGVWTGFHMEIGYQSIEIMCSSIQEILRSPDLEFESLHAMGTSRMATGLRIIRIFRAAGGFLNSGTVREGFVGLCDALSQVSSSADKMMCAALTMDSPSELVRQCLSLCGYDPDGDFSDPNGSYDPENGEGDPQDPEGSNEPHDETEGSEDSQIPEGGSNGPRDPDGAGEPQDETEGSDDSQIPEGGFNGPRDPDGAGEPQDEAEGSDDSQIPEGGFNGPRDPDGAGEPQDETEGSDDSQIPEGGLNGPRDPDGAGEPRDETKGSDDSQIPEGGFNGLRDPDGAGEPRDETEGFENPHNPEGGYGNPREPENSGNQHTDGSGNLHDGESGSGNLWDPEGSGHPRDPLEGSGYLHDKEGGSGYLWDQEGSGHPRDPLEGSGYLHEREGGSGYLWDPEGSGHPRDPFEGSGNFRDPTDGSGHLHGPRDGSGDHDYVFSIPHGVPFWFSDDFLDSWEGFSHINLLNAWLSEWFQDINAFGNINQGSSFLNIKKLLEAVFDLKDADSDAICNRFAWEIHEDDLTVREVVIKALDDTLEFFLHLAPGLCGQDSGRGPFGGKVTSTPLWSPEYRVTEKPSWSPGLEDGVSDNPRRPPGDGVTDEPLRPPGTTDGVTDEPLRPPSPTHGLSDNPLWSPGPGYERSDYPFLYPRPDSRVTDNPKWWYSDVDVGSRWEHGHIGPLPGHVVGELFAFLGDFYSKEEMCKDTEAESYRESLSDRVVAMRNKLLAVTKDVHVCHDFLGIIDREIDLFHSITTSFMNAEDMCAKISFAFGPDNHESLSNIVSPDFEEPNLDFGRLLVVGGILFNASVKEAALLPCQKFSGTPLDSLELERDCSLLSDPDPLPLIGKCKEFFEGKDWFANSDNVGGWWPSFLPSFWDANSKQLPAWLKEMVQGDLAVLFYDMFGYRPDSSPEEFCLRAEQIVTNEDFTMRRLVDRALDATLRFIAHASPELCYNETGTTVRPSESPIFSTIEMPSWARRFIQNFQISLPDSDSRDLLGAVFTFLGHYGSSDELCQDSVEAVAEGADPALLDGMVDTIKETVYSLTEDIDVCEALMDIVQETLEFPLSIGNSSGFGSNRDFCTAIKRAFDPATDFTINLAAVKNLLIFDNSHEAEKEEEAWNLLTPDILSLVGHLYNAGTFKEVVDESCNIFNQNDEVDVFLGEDFVPLCEWAQRPHDLNHFLEVCFSSFELPWENPHNPDDDSDPWKSENGVEPEESSWEDELLGWLRVILGDNINSYSDFVTWVEDMFGFDISTDERVCSNAKDIISNENMTITQMVDTAMDVSLRLLAHASPWLCNNGPDGPVDPTAAPKFTSTPMPSWVEDVLDNVYRDMPEVDPLTVLGDIVSFLGHYQNSDDLCRDSLEAVAEGADPALLDGMVRTIKESLYSLLNDADYCASYVDLLQESLHLPFSIGDVTGFGSNQGLCEAIRLAFDPHTDQEIDFSVFRMLIPSDTEQPDGQFDSPASEQESALIPEVWQLFIREMIKIAGRLYHSGTITQAVGTSCDIVDQMEIDLEAWIPEIGMVCDWSRRGSDLDEFYHACLEFIDLPWDDTPDDDWDSGESDESSWEDELLGWLRVILGDNVNSYSDFVTWVEDMFGFDISTDKRVCSNAKDIISNGDMTITQMVDTAMDVSLRLLAHASPWLCNNEPKEPVDPTAAPKFTSTPMPPWAEDVLNNVYSDMPEVDPLTVLGDIMSFLGHYQNSDDLCRDSLEAVAEGADPALLDGMVRTIKESLYSLLNDADYCASYVDLLQESLHLPFSIGDVTGFGSNQGLCEAIRLAFDPHTDQEIDFSVFRMLIPSDTEQSDGQFDSPASEQEYALIPEEWQLFIREMIKIAGRLYHSGTITQAVGTSCDIVDQMEIDLEAWIPEIGMVCDWSRRGSDLDEFYHACLEFIDLPWDDTPDDDWDSGESDESSWEDELLGWLRVILGDNVNSYSDFVTWVEDMFEFDISTDERVCSNAMDIISNGDMTITQMVDTAMDVSLRLLAHASPWLCNNGPEEPVDPTAAPKFTSTPMPPWAEDVLNNVYSDMPEVDPLTVLGDIMSFLGHYQNSDDLCRDSLEAVAEGADPALLDGMVSTIKESLYSLLNDADYCASYVDLLQESLHLPFFIGDVTGFGSNQGLCEAIRLAFDPHTDQEIDFSVFRMLIPSDTEQPDGQFDSPASEQESALIPEEWQLFIREMIKIAGRLYHSGTITQAVGTSCDIVDQMEIDLEAWIPEIGMVCDWSRRGSDLDEFYHACLEFIDLPWDDTPDDDWDSGESDESSWEDELLGWLRVILGDNVNSYLDFVTWVEDMFGFDISTDKRVCSNAKDIISNGNMTITQMVDTAMDVSLRLLAHASPWLCNNGPEEPVDPTVAPKFNSTPMPPWAEDVLNNVYSDMPEVDPLTVLGDIMSFLGHYQNSDDLCRDSLEAVAEGADPALLDGMVSTIKESLYSLLNDADYCASYVDLLQESLHLPFSIGDVTGFGSNQGLCEAIRLAFDPHTDQEIDFSVFRMLIPSDMEQSDGQFDSPASEQESALIPEEWQLFIREMIKIAGWLYHSGTITQAVSTSCDIVDQMEIDLEAWIPEIGMVCDWSRRGSDPEEFYYACLEVVNLPWDNTPNDPSSPESECAGGWWTSLLFQTPFDFELDKDDTSWGIDDAGPWWWPNTGFAWGSGGLAESSGYSELLTWLKDTSEDFSNYVLWVEDMFGLDTSTPEQVCGSAREFVADQSFTIPVIFDTAMDTSLRYLAQATPWICNNGSETTDYRVALGSGFIQMLPWAESLMENVYIDESEVDPLDVLGDMISFLGNYENSDELCRATIEAVAEGADPAALDNIISTIKNSVSSVLNSADYCALYMNHLQDSLNLPLIIGNVTGFGSNRGLCEAVVVAFDPETSFEVDVSSLLLLVSSESIQRDDSDSRSNGTADALNNLEDENEFEAAQPTRETLIGSREGTTDQTSVNAFHDILRLVGHLYNVGTFRDAVRAICDILDQSGESLDGLGLDIGATCEWSREEPDLEEFYERCLAVYNQHENNYDDADSSTDVSFDNGNDFFEDIVQMIYGQLISNPYSACETFGSVLESDTADVLDIGKSFARTFLASQFSGNRLSAKCMHYYRNASFSGFNPPGFTVFSDIERLFAELAGRFRNGSDFCNFVLSFEDRENSVVGAVVDGAFNILNDVGSCNSLLYLLFGNEGQATFTQITGFETMHTFCDYLYDSFHERTNVTQFELKLPEGFDPTVYTPVEGEYLPGVTVQDLVSFAGALLTTDKFQDSMILACDGLAPLLDDSIFPDLGEFAGICDVIRKGDTQEAVTKCEQFLIPLMFGEDFPIELRYFDFGRRILEIVLPLFNYEPEFGGDVICPAIETILNSDSSPVNLATEVANGLLRTGIEYGAGVCQNIDKVYNYLLPDGGTFLDPSRSYYDAELAEVILDARQEFQRNFYGYFDFASTMAGFESADLMCAALIDADQDNETFDNLVDLLRERVFSYLTNEGECKIAVESTIRLINLVSSDVEAGNLLYQVTGYFSPQAFCIVFTAAFRGEADTELETCFGIVDCAGVCNGEAVYDCAGFCGGSAVRDCANVCNGAATLNSCDLCVGGSTGRRADLGQDRCGTCWTDTDYRITWDCHGTCNGTAFVDACGECVGGETGKAADYNQPDIDCRGVCYGTWIVDGCGFCEPFDESSLGVASLYMDCNGDCFTPGATSSRAELNQCGICYGGNTGEDATSGVNACGQCLTDSWADEASCSGCDGVPNSGKTYDACGICGGNGTTCFGVGWVIPSLVSENSDTQLELYGAGFEEGSALACIFEDAEGAQTQSDSQYGSYVTMTCNVPTLAAGDYKVKVQRDGVISDAIYANFTVLPEIEVLTVSPSEVTLNSSVENIMLTFTATEGAFSSVKAAGIVPSLIVEGDWNVVLSGWFDDLSDSIVYFNVPMPSTSKRITAWPSLNGVERLTTPDDAGFQLTAYAPAPEFTEAYFASTGAAVITRFSSGVNFYEFSGCDDVFENTAKLGSNPFCRWVGATTMYIILGTGDDLLAVGDELVIKTDSVKAFRETYSRYVAGSQTLAGPANPVVPTVVLYGTKRITSCGTVRASGRQTKGSAGRAMTYTWAVSSEGETAALEAVLADENGVEIAVSGSLMDAETVYSLSLTAENFLGESDTAYFNVSRSALAVPEVEITVRGVDPDSVYVSDSFDLTAKVTFYSDCVPPGETVFSWEVDNDDVPLNLKTMRKRTLHVDANSLPGDSTLVFTVTLYKSSEPENNVTQSITVQTVYSELVPIIYGGSELTVGRDNGQFVLDGSGSFDLDVVAVDMVYEWQCYQVTDNTACWSFAPGEEGTKFPSAEAAAMSVLSIPANAMEADKSYEFTLVVSKLTRSASTSVRVTALDGDPPKVDITTTIDERVSAEKSLSLSANIYHDVPLSSYVWETVGTDEGYAYLDLSDASNLDGAVSLYPFGSSNGSITFLTIKAGKLTAGSTYSVQLTATTVDGQYGIAKIQFTALAGVTSCVFSLNGISSYTELESVMYTLENCVADETAYPLSYRVFLLDGGRKQTLSERTQDPAINGVGKPVTDDSSSTNTFVAEVCDTYDSCTYFYHTVDVSVVEECTADYLLQLVDNLVTVEKYKQNFASALVNYNVIQEKCTNSTSARRRRRSVVSVETTSAAATEQLSLVRSSIDNSVLDTSSAQFLIDQCNYINTDDLAIADKSAFIDVLVELTAVFETAGVSVPEDSAAIVLDKATEIRRTLNETYHSTILATITSLTSSLDQAQMSQLQLGALALETVSSAMTRSVQRAIPSGVFSSKSSGGNTVDFGSALSTRFSADWACSSGSCSGVTVSFEHWGTGEDEFSLTDEDRANVAADITDIKLLDPSSGDELTVANLTEKISINLTVTLPQAGKTYECRYWDTSSQTWATDGLETVLDASNSSSVECLTDHLTAFTVLAVEQPSTVAPTSGAVTDSATDSETAAATTDTEAPTTTAETIDEPIEDPGDSSTVIIIVVVVCVVVVVLVVVIGAVLIVKAKQRGKIAAADENSNIPDEEALAGASVPARPEQWAAERPQTPRRSPVPPQQQEHSPRPQEVQASQTVQVVTVPVALETAPLSSLPPPASPHMVAEMDDVTPPPVYLPPAQNTSMTLTDVS